MKPINKYFDHTLLSPAATRNDILTLCQEAKDYDFYAVCVASSYVSLAAKELQNSDVLVASVIGFPLGTCFTETKVQEATAAMQLGAREVDMVINLGALKDGCLDYVSEDIGQVAAVCEKYQGALKVIIESHLLSDMEIPLACRLALEAGADFVKTSTGFSNGGASIKAVSLMKSCVKDNAYIKASGGIRTLETALAMIKAGADRIGASASVSIMKEALNNGITLA